MTKTVQRPATDHQALSASAVAAGPLQHTISTVATVEGIGLFTAVPATVRICPAPPDHGIAFRRTDLAGTPDIPATVEFAVDAPRRTALQKDRASVQTVEHLLSACRGVGLDNAIIEVDGPEIPILDGSALPFVEAILEATLEAQPAERRPIVITQPITLHEGDKTISALPIDSGQLELLYMLDYTPGSPIPRQVQSLVLTSDDYVHEIAPARTFSTRQEAQAAWDAGLFHHLTPRDMLVIDEEGPIDNEFRFEDEPVRHKIVDLLGDLALTGRPVHGRIVGVRTGHELNRKLARALLDPALVKQGVPSDAPTALNIREALSHVEGRFPAVLIDRVLELEPGQSAVAVKNVSASEPFFAESEGTDRMPAVLIIEAFAQLATIMLGSSAGDPDRALRDVESATIHRPVTPGDQLLIEVRARTRDGRPGVDACAWVAGALAADAWLAFGR